MNYPCDGCIIKTVCSTACSKIQVSNVNKTQLFKRIKNDRCCPDCGCDEGYIFYEFEYILCSTCNSLFYSSPSIRPRNIIRYINYKYIIDKETPAHYVTTFGIFIDTIKRIRSLEP